jgi:hypothetical protein
MTEHGRDVAPAVEAPQPYLAAGHQAEQEDKGGVLGGQAALRFHAVSRARWIVGAPGMLVALTGLLWLTRRRWKGVRVATDFGI